MRRDLRKSWLGCVSAMLVCVLCVGPAEALEHVRLATTTSTEQSGLLEVLLPPFERQTGIRVDVIAVGSGKALKLGENGDVDVVLSHAPALEEQFMAAGFGVNRRDVMYNDFVVVGPAADPAGIGAAHDALDAFRLLAGAGATFVSRGDESGTHQKEKELWGAAGGAPNGAGIVSAGLGMGEVLRMADERQAYTLTDRGTFLALRSHLHLQVLVQGDPLLFNPYTVMAVNPARHPGIRYAEAMQLIAWLTSPQGQDTIADFRVDGERLFQPVAVPPEIARLGRAEATTLALVEALSAALGLVASRDPDVLAAVFLSLRVALLGTLFATSLGVPLGFVVATREFRGRRGVEMILNTSTALPTVVVGLLTYAVLSRHGLLGPLGLLYTPTAMVIGETILITPLMAALTVAVVSGADPRIQETALTLGASRTAAAFTVLREARRGLLGSLATGFGRLVSELGIALMVGGNIRGATRTMTTAIALETGKGEFAQGLALGFVLLGVALVVNVGASLATPSR